MPGFRKCEFLIRDCATGAVEHQMKTHREEKGLKGPVKSVRLEVARFAEQHGEQPDYCSQ